MLQIVTNNDTATLAQICDYIDMDRKPTLSERFWDDSARRKLIEEMRRSGNLEETVKALQDEAEKRRRNGSNVLWVANKRFEISKFKFKFPRARTYEIIGLVLGCIEAKFCK